MLARNIEENEINIEKSRIFEKGMVSILSYKSENIRILRNKSNDKFNSN